MYSKCVYFIIFQVTYVHATIDEQFSQWCTCGCCIPTFSKPSKPIRQILSNSIDSQGGNPMKSSKITEVEVSRLSVIESNGWLKFQRVLFFCCWVFRVFSSLIHFTVTKEKTCRIIYAVFWDWNPCLLSNRGPKSWKMQGFSPRCSCFTYPNIFPIFFGADCRIS